MANFNEMSVVELTELFAKNRMDFDAAEENFKAYKSQMDKYLGALQAEILNRMNSENKTKFSTDRGDFTRTTKQRASITSTAQLEEAIKANPSLIQFVSMKAKSTELKKYVEENGEVPSDLFTYERYHEITFRKAK